MSPDIRTLETPGLGDRSYVAILDGWAVAVDVQRDIDRVEAVLADAGARLGAVVETHIHNDYLTGGLALARKHGAEYVVPAGPRLGYSATRTSDGTAVTVGALTLRAIDSPGHTDAHATYALGIEDGPALAAFTGGSLLLGATGRTDLLGREQAEALARRQYWSARRLARLVGGDAVILPTHGFGSFCVAGMPVASGATLAEQIAANPAFLLSEDEFVADSLSRLGAYPSYYAFMGPRNAGGVDAADLAPLPRLDARGLAALQASGRVVVDIRARADWADLHVADSLSIDGRGAVATWLGWFEPIDARIALVSACEEQTAHVVRELRRIGFDDIDGVLVTTDLAAHAAGEPALRLASTRRASFADLAEAMAQSAWHQSPMQPPSLADVTSVEQGSGGAVRPLVLDTRESSEWRAGHVAGALHVSAHDIVSTFAGALPLRAPWVYCGAGFRAAIVASQLERLGAPVVLVDDDVVHARLSGVRWCEGDQCRDGACLHDLVTASV